MLQDQVGCKGRRAGAGVQVNPRHFMVWALPGSPPPWGLLSERASQGASVSVPLCVFWGEVSPRRRQRWGGGVLCAERPHPGAGKPVEVRAARRPLTRRAGLGGAGGWPQAEEEEEEEARIF